MQISASSAAEMDKETKLCKRLEIEREYHSYRKEIWLVAKYNPEEYSRGSTIAQEEACY